MHDLSKKINIRKSLGYFNYERIIAQYIKGT